MPSATLGPAESARSRTPLLVRFDRAHLKALGDSAVQLEAVYYMTNPDYALFMDTQQQVNLEVLKRFNAEGVEFAFPTRTVYVEGDSAPKT